MTTTRAQAEQRVSKRVQREIAEANEKLLAAGRANPKNPDYIRHKAILRYAWKHRMTLHEAQAAWVAMEKKKGARIYQ